MSNKAKKSGASKWFRREKWYEIVELFAADKIQKLPMKQGRSFILGNIGELTVVEVSKDTPEEVVKSLGRYLREQGISAILVPPDVRFMRLREATPNEERVLNDAAYEDDCAPGGADAPDAEDGGGRGSVAEGDGSGGDGDGRDEVPSDEEASDREQTEGLASADGDRGGREEVPD